MRYETIQTETGGVLYADLSGASVESIVGNPHAVILVLANGHKAFVTGSIEDWQARIDLAAAPTVQFRDGVKKRR